MKRLLRSIKCVSLSWCSHSPIGNGGQKLSPLLHSDQQHTFQRSDIRQRTITRPDHASAWLECFLPNHYVLEGSESPRGEGEREGVCLRKSTTCPWPGSQSGSTGLRDCGRVSPPVIALNFRTAFRIMASGRQGRTSSLNLTDC